MRVPTLVALLVGLGVIPMAATWLFTLLVPEPLPSILAIVFCVTVGGVVAVSAMATQDRRRDGVGETSASEAVRHQLEAERQLAERTLRAAVEEKVVMLQEVHHRVKNNLQLVASLLSMQARPVEEPKAKQALLNTAERVRSIAALHEELYQTGNLDHVDFNSYLRKLATRLTTTCGAADQMATVGTECPVLPIATAVPVALLCNELVSNAFKHGFPDGGGGVVDVQLSRENGTLTLTVTDTGVGLPPKFDPARGKTLGFKLVQALTEQLEGALDFPPHSTGAAIRVTFPLQPA